MQTERRFASTNAPTASGRKVRGYAATFNSRSQNLGTDAAPWYEIIAPGAFDGVLNNDVRALQDHDSSRILARSNKGKGTLKIGTDATGLWYEFEAPDTSVGNDLLVSLRRGDISGSSFSFTISKDTWKQEGNARVRTIHKIKTLLDVGPVSYPAYPDATVAARKQGPSKAHPSIQNWEKRLDLLK